METLSFNDLLSLNSAIAEIYAARDMESFYSSAFSCIQGMIPCELCSCADVKIHPARFLKTITSSPEHGKLAMKLMPAFNRHIQKHPLFPYVFSGEVVKTTDYVSGSQFKNSAIHDEYYRHLDVETQICFSLPVSQETVAIFGLSRKCNTDFSERDRIILVLLKHHLTNALRHITELDRSRIQKDFLLNGVEETDRQGVLLCQPDGRLSHMSAFAKEMMGKYFDAAIAEGDSLPGALLQWFTSEAPFPSLPVENRVSGCFPKQVERQPLIIEKEESFLNIKLLNDCTTGEYILVMIEMDPSSRMPPMHAYGLTLRETEVLLWLTKGKTNVEIASILGMSKRTVEKHMEHIFTKLGVETRGAAAAIMKKG